MYGSTLHELLAVGDPEASRTEIPGTLLKLVAVDVDPDASPKLSFRVMLLTEFAPGSGLDEPWVRLRVSKRAENVVGLKRIVKEKFEERVIENLKNDEVPARVE